MGNGGGGSGGWSEYASELLVGLEFDPFVALQHGLNVVFRVESSEQCARICLRPNLPPEMISAVVPQQISALTGPVNIC